jgi:hypothetical protein
MTNSNIFKILWITGKTADSFQRVQELPLYNLRLKRNLRTGIKRSEQ